VTVLLLETTWRYTDHVADDLASAADPFASDVGTRIIATATSTRILRMPGVRVDMVYLLCRRPLRRARSPR
jgi:hypothetical protein